MPKSLTVSISQIRDIVQRPCKLSDLGREEGGGGGGGFTPVDFVVTMRPLSVKGQSCSKKVWSTVIACSERWLTLTTVNGS